MPEIKVRNVNGKLVGIDENGNRVALEFEDTVHDSVNTDQQSVGGQPEINYWPPVRKSNPSNEVDQSSPVPTTFTTETIAGVPSDASVVILQVAYGGDGTADAEIIQLKEAGVSRDLDAEIRFWAGHQAVAQSEIVRVPLNASNQIEYKTSGTTSRLLINGLAYY